FPVRKRVGPFRTPVPKLLAWTMRRISSSSDAQRPLLRRTVYRRKRGHTIPRGARRRNSCRELHFASGSDPANGFGDVFDSLLVEFRARRQIKSICPKPFRHWARHWPESRL